MGDSQVLADPILLPLIRALLVCPRRQLQRLPPERLLLLHCPLLARFQALTVCRIALLAQRRTLQIPHRARRRLKHLSNPPRATPAVYRLRPPLLITQLAQAQQHLPDKEHQHPAPRPLLLPAGLAHLIADRERLVARAVAARALLVVRVAIRVRLAVLTLAVVREQLVLPGTEMVLEVQILQRPGQHKLPAVALQHRGPVRVPFSPQPRESSVPLRGTHPARRHRRVAVKRAAPVSRSL
ncbi:hypothetical protein C8Q79DRAFT_51351 [Trametes meyenii]|nr:hypothetical protein C8Q79DRAFT_51351 [Trametes meyenii]